MYILYSVGVASSPVTRESLGRNVTRRRLARVFLPVAVCWGGWMRPAAGG